MEITKFSLLILIVGLFLVFGLGFVVFAGLDIIDFIVLVIESIIISIGLLLILLGIGMMI